MKARLLLVLLGLAFAPRAALAADDATAAANAECAQILSETATDCDQLKTALDAKAAAGAGQDVSALDTQIETLASKPLSPLFVERKRDGRLILHCAAVKGVKACIGLASLLTQGLIDKPSPDVKNELNEEVALQQQPDRQTSNNKSGSAAQADPVESIQPIALAGGAVSLSGTRSGTKGVGTITVNPFAVAAPGDVTASRFLDLSVSAPFDLDGGTDQDRRYVSARLRANFTAPVSTADLKAALKAYFAAEGQQVVLLESVLERASNRRGCAASVLTTTKVTVEGCGQTLDDAFVHSLREDAYKQIEKTRRAADAYYFGLDARLDTGDPTGTVVVGDKGTHLLGGLAAGRRFELAGRWDWELRGRAAFDYFKSRDAVAGPDPKPISSFDWGCAMILSGRLTEQAKQRMAFGVGVEGRHAGNKDDAKTELAPTNFANLNLMTIVPAADGGDLGLAISIPLADSAVPRGTIISLSTDLGLLDHSTTK